VHVLPPYRRLLLLTEGRLGVFSSKTAAVLLRYRAQDVVAVVDSVAAAGDLRAAVPWAPRVPIIADVRQAASLRPDALFIGVAPVGGALPEEMARHVEAALRVGLDVVSGLHTRLADDPRFAALARAHDSAAAQAHTAQACEPAPRILDLRTPPAQQVVASARARDTRCRRVLTVGTDCNVGKMVAALELARAGRAAGLDARFVATGQTGIMIEGRGVAIDAVVADFVAGAVEELVLSVAGCDLCVVEGQGSIGHPGYSGVTLSLLHGVCPDAMVLVHHAGRERHNAEPHHPLAPIRQQIAAYEQAAALLHPARVVAIALNTVNLAKAAAREAAERLEGETGLPTADVMRDGCERLLTACLAAPAAGA
jgi:uncharacterized NAD-dependent epimerase/dehydratase family protein